MESRSLSPMSADNQARPASSFSQSVSPITSNRSSIRSTLPAVESFSAQCASAFGNDLSQTLSGSPSYHNEHRMSQSSENPASMSVPLDQPIHEGEDGSKHQVSTTLLSVDDQEETAKVSKNCIHYIIGQWRWEIVSFILAVGTLIALVVILIECNGYPQPALPYKVSINTLVSIFSTIIKALMLVSVSEGVGQLKWLWYQKPHLLRDFGHFDGATRGPLGATKLLWTLKLKHLASLGAFIAVISIALEPFTQAVLQLYSCNVVLPTTNATIPRSNNYTAGGDHIGAGESNLNQPMQNAIFNGIYNSANTSQTTFQCSSGNCTFPTYEGTSYQSIGVCSQCVDKKEDLSKNCVKTVGEDFNSTLCNITLSTFPSGVSLEPGEYFRSYPLLYDQFGEASLPPDSSLGHFSLIMYNHSYEDTSGESYPIAAYFATECALYTCVKSYSATVSGGSLTESVTNVSFNLQPYNPVNATYILSSPCVINGSLIAGEALEGDHPNDELWQQMELDGDSTYVLKECVYEISPATLMALDGFFPTLFDGYVDGTYDVGVEASPDWLSVLYDSSNGTEASINTVVEGIATSMTNHMRQNGQAGNSKLAYGVVFGTETCVRVIWGWIAFPAAAVGLTALFLILTIIKSWRHPGRLGWKSEILPVLYHGLDTQLRNAAGVANQAKDMEHFSSTVTVHLQRTEKGWTLVKSISSTDVMGKENNEENQIGEV